MKKLVCLLMVFITVSVKAQTYSINGTVTDERGDVVRGATTFITSSSYITATDNEGKFTFNKLESGSYEVVVKMLGSAPFTQSVVVHDKPVNLTIRLKASNTMLNGVVIRGRPDPNRETYLELFTKNFLGETVNAQQCEILNPDIISFHYNNRTRVLTANADDFIVVENKALGYKLKYLLADFEVNTNTFDCAIGGSAYFEELPGKPAQQKKWNNNRRVAYLSSSRHFFRSVMSNTTKTEGYIAYQVINDPAVINELHERSPTDIMEYYQTTPFGKLKRYAARIADINSLFTDNGRKFKILNNGVARLGLFVIYTGQDQSPLYYRTSGPYDLPLPLPAKTRRNAQTSQLKSLTDTVVIDINSAWPSSGFQFSGYWAWLRIADLMPLDYFVDPMEEKKK